VAVNHLSDEEIQGYLEGDIPRSTEISRHLKKCATCQQELQSYRQVYRALEQDSGFELSSGFAESVMGRLTVTSVSTSQNSLINSILIILGSIITLGITLYFANGAVVVEMFKGVSSGVTDIGAALIESFQSVTSSLGVRVDVLLFTLMLLLMFTLLDHILVRSRGSHFCL
jgi:anti-sigma factor RsiW